MAREDYPPNPFTVADGEQAESMIAAVKAWFELAAMTCPLDPRLTTMYGELVAWSIGRITGDPATGMFAGLFELGCIARELAGRSPVMPKVATEPCDDPHCDGNCMEQAAFIAACIDGDFTSAVNVVKAAYKQGQSEGTDHSGEERLARTFAGISYVMSRSTNDPDMFDGED